VSALGIRTEAVRDPLKVLLVGKGAELRSQVRAALSGLAEPPLAVSDCEPAAAMDSDAANGSGPVDVVMFAFNGNEESLLTCLQAQAAQSPRPALFALLPGRSAGLMKRVLRAGADELLFLPLDVGDATRALLKISEAQWRARRREGGVICSFASIVGGVGVTTLAGNLALALNYEFEQRVALVDLDLQTGGLAVFLNLEPEATIMPLARLDKKLDSMQLESALTKHPSGVYLLAAPRRIEEGELISDITVGAVLDLMRQLFDYVIVDCGSHLDENAVAAWERSEHMFYVLDQSIRAARCAWRFIDLFDRLGLSSVEPHFILNRFVASYPIGDKQIESSLTRRIYAHIPRDDKTAERVELSAKDLWQVAAGSPLAKAVEDLARRVVPGREVAAGTQQGLVSRLLSAINPR
jgi:pilus assembly protein CpaE